MQRAFYAPVWKREYWQSDAGRYQFPNYTEDCEGKGADRDGVIIQVDFAVLGCASLVELFEMMRNVVGAVVWEIHAFCSMQPAFGSKKQVKEFITEG